PQQLLSHRYRIERLIGEGTFGWVFLAVDLRGEHGRVALKMLRPEHAAIGDAVRRFEDRELKLLRRVQEEAPTRNVASAIEKEIQGHRGLLFIVLEFIEGASLEEEIARRAPLSPIDVARIGADIARGLGAIHKAGGVHRDLKPANIRLH